MCEWNRHSAFGAKISIFSCKIPPPRGNVINVRKIRYKIVSGYRGKDAPNGRIYFLSGHFYNEADYSTIHKHSLYNLPISISKTYISPPSKRTFIDFSTHSINKIFAPFPRRGKRIDKTEKPEKI